MTTDTTIMTGIPHSREAEEALIGSVLINPQVFDEVGLPDEAFYIHRLRFIWQAYQRLKDKSRAIDNLTVCEELDDMGRLEEIGGPAFLTALLNQVPTTLNAGDYADIVREHHARRLLLSAANEMARLAFAGELNQSELIAQAESALRKVTQQVEQAEQVVDVTEVASELYDRALERGRLAQAGKPIASRRVATKLMDVDQVLKGGLRPGSLNLVAGRPGQGKTSWMQTVALNAVEQGKRVGYFSLEMGKDEMVARLLSASSGLDANHITEGILVESDWEALVTTLEGLQTGMLFIADTATLTPSTLRAQAYQLQARYGLDLLIVDYLQLMRPGVRLQNREQEVAHCSRELKILAGELKIPVLAAAQLSRASEMRAEREPQLSDLRESGALENDADVVMFIWRPDEDTNISRLKVAKHRGGPVGSADLYFDTRLTRFQNATTRQVEK
jgi:replicative DNA helicase